MRQWNIPPQLPPIEGLEHIAEAWHQCGLSLVSGGMIAPLTWQEIQAWKSCGGIELEHWETEVIHAASAVYVSHYHKGKPQHAEPPYEPEELTPEYIEAMNRKIEHMFRG